MSTLILDDVATDDNFHEQAYRLANPDVAEAVKRGNMRSGKDHFELWGRKEERRLRLSVLDAFAFAKASKLRKDQASSAKGYALRCRKRLYRFSNR